VKLLRAGALVLNMDQLIAVRDEGDHICLVFASGAQEGDSGSGSLSFSLEGPNCDAFRMWLTRMGVHDLSAETPLTFGWPSVFQSPGSGGKIDTEEASVLYSRKSR
jgi:hypothetical protein